MSERTMWYALAVYGVFFVALAVALLTPESVPVSAPEWPDVPVLRIAAALPALPTNVDSIWRPTRRHGAYRGITGEWIVRR